MQQSVESFVLRYALLTQQEVEHLKRRFPGTNLLAAATEEGLLAAELAHDCQRLCDQGQFEGLDPKLPGMVLLDLIGKGTMGRVFRAWQTNLRRVVAVKVLPNSALETKEALGRAVREARIAARLSHPSLVRAFDVVQTADALCIVLEYVEGETLRERLKRADKLSVKETLRIVLGVAEGLAFAAANGIAHRDIKPGNIQLTPRGGVKILDLGLARPGGESTLTAPMVVHGTPAYVAPEQARGETNLTPAVDVYALGILLFRALSGRHPFKVENAKDMLRAHISGTPPLLTRVVRDAPEGLSHLIASMLAKDPGERPDAATVAGHLRLYLERMGELSATPLQDTGKQHRTRFAKDSAAAKPVGVAVIAAALLISAAAIWFLGGGDSAAAERERELLEREEELEERAKDLQQERADQAAWSQAIEKLAQAAEAEAGLPPAPPESIEEGLDDALDEHRRALGPSEQE